MCQHPADIVEAEEGYIQEVLCDACLKKVENVDVQELAYIPLEKRGFCTKCLKAAKKVAEEFEP